MPTLVLFAGLPGSGKTTIARAFATRMGALHLNSDTVRRDMGLMGRYAPDDKQRVYTELLERTQSALQNGQTVVIDSTFAKADTRTPFVSLATRQGVVVYWVQTFARDEVIRERLRQPRPDSEADFEVYQRIAAEADPLPEPVCRVDTEAYAPEGAVDFLLRHLPI